MRHLESSGSQHGGFRETECGWGLWRIPINGCRRGKAKRNSAAETLRQKDRDRLNTLRRPNFSFAFWRNAAFGKSVCMRFFFLSFSKSFHSQLLQGCMATFARVL
jgi:hypothetical protein